MILITYKYPTIIDENGNEITDYESTPVSDSNIKEIKEINLLKSFT